IFSHCGYRHLHSTIQWVVSAVAWGRPTVGGPLSQPVELKHFYAITLFRSFHVPSLLCPLISSEPPSIGPSPHAVLRYHAPLVQARVPRGIRRVVGTIASDVVDATRVAREVRHGRPEVVAVARDIESRDIGLTCVL